MYSLNVLPGILVPSLFDQDFSIGSIRLPYEQGSGLARLQIGVNPEVRSSAKVAGPFGYWSAEPFWVSWLDRHEVICSNCGDTEP
jgi:hypothetical protein